MSAVSRNGRLRPDDTAPAALERRRAQEQRGAVYQLIATKGLEHAAGVVGLVFVGVAAYVGLASLIEDAAHRSILPLGRRNRARAAIDEGVTAHLVELQQEAGVREQL